MATTGIIQRRDVKANLIADPPLVGEIVFAVDTYEFGTMINGTLTWRSFTDIISSVNGHTGVVVLDKNDISLDQVDNTADIDKPVSTATQNAIDNVPQSDWNETDNTNKAYIQNKPINITTQGNTFNNADELLKLDSNGKIPTLDGSQLINLPLELPTQASNDNKFLITDGTNPSWVNIDGNVSPITLKYSDDAGYIPSTGDITLGEFFINTNDGKTYFKKDDGTAQIISISNDGHQHDISDINDLANELSLKLDVSEKGAARGVATLNANGKIPDNQLPPLAISETYTADSETNQLALTVQSGDVCVRTDINSTYIALNSSNSNMNDWQEIKTPNSSASSVNGQTGTVVLDTDDISEGSTNLYFTIPRVIDAIGASKDDNGDTPNDLWSADKIKTYVDDGVSTASACHDTVDPDAYADNSNHHFIGQVWVNTTTSAKFICTDDTNAAAVWELIRFSDGDNTGSGSKVFKQLNSDTLEFRTLVPGSNKLEITENSDTISLDVNLDATNIGTGSHVYSGLNGTNFEFRTLKASSDRIEITENADTISLDVNLDAINIGTGSHVYSGLNNNNFEFKTLEASSNKLEITENADTISLDVNLDVINIGTGSAIYSGANGTDLEFRTLKSNSNRLDITENSDNITLDVVINDSGDTDQDIWSASKIQSQIDNIIIKKENRAPASSDDMYDIGQIWINTSNNATYICVDNTSTAAVWDSIVKEQTGIINIDYPLVKIDNNISSTDIDCSLGNVFNKDVTSDTTFTFSNVPSSFFEIIIELTNAASYNVSFPSSVKYENNTAPTYSTHTDVLRMYTKDGGNTWFAKLDYSDVY